MAGGYTQVKLDPAVISVHLGAGLAQCLGQLINVWTGSLPVVVITFAGDTGSYADRVGLDLSHNVGPTSISGPFTKANWTVIEPEGLPQAVARALQVARTPPVGPVHLAVYDRLLDTRQVRANIVEGGVPDLRAGYPADGDVEAVARALHEAERPLLYVGDGVWKSGAEAQVAALAEQVGAPVAGGWAGWISARPGVRAVTSLTLGLYFMVQEPSGYMAVSTLWFLCERRRKWRMTSISEASGSGRSDRTWESGRTDDGSTGSNWRRGGRTPRRPGLERS